MKTTQTTGTKFFDGIPLHVPNEVMRNDSKFYVSFNKSSRDYGCPTTALVVAGKFFILCGDHREQYKQAGTLDNCLAYYQQNKHLQHGFSDKMGD